jgi:glycine/D-amino acid oxidase-like deaminating enzyme
VIGGGYTGLSAALAAAEQGAEVVLLEAARVGHGGSGRNAGLVNAGLWLPPDDIAARLGHGPGEVLNATLAAAPDRVFDLIDRHGIACEPQRAGTLHLAHSRGGLRDLHRRAEQAQARGAPVALLSAGETAQRTGSARFHGALHDPRAGTIQPLAYARGLARAATTAGARIFEMSAVRFCQQHGGQWILRTDGGKLRARRLLMATNAYHHAARGTHLPDLPVTIFFQIATAPLDDKIARDILPGGEGGWDTGRVMTALRRDGRGRVILGGMGAGGALHEGWARRKLTRLFPRLFDAPLDHVWAGRIAMTRDRLPRILRLGSGGVAVFGYSGQGVAPGTIFGEAAARALLAGDETGLPIPVVESHTEKMAALRTLGHEMAARMVHLVAGRI